MLDEQCSLSQISEKIGELSGNSPPISGLSDYIKKYPKEAEVSKSIEAKPTEKVTIATTEKEIEPLSVTKQAADKVFSSVEENRAASPTGLITQDEQEKQPEPIEEVKPKSPFAKLKKLGKDKPFKDPNEDRYL